MVANHARRHLSRALIAVVALWGAAPIAALADAEASQRARVLADSACAKAGDLAAALTQNFSVLQDQLAQAFAQTQREARRELAPLVDRFADQLRDLARQLESTRDPRDS